MLTDHIFSSSRYRYISGQKVKCWNNHANGKHSNLNIQGGLLNSCNPIFVDMAMSLGKETMYKYIEKFKRSDNFNKEKELIMTKWGNLVNISISRALREGD